MLARLESRLVDGVVTVTASEHREQRRNREAARTRLAALLADAVAPPGPPRRRRGSADRPRRRVPRSGVGSRRRSAGRRPSSRAADAGSSTTSRWDPMSPCRDDGPQPGPGRDPERGWGSDDSPIGRADALTPTRGTPQLIA
jgi:hypothetical protein